MSVAAALFLLSGGLRTLTTSGISLRLARALLKFTVALGRLRVSSLIRALRATRKSAPGGFFPKAMKNMVAYRLPIFLSFENDEVSGSLPVSGHGTCFLPFENDELAVANFEVALSIKVCYVPPICPGVALSGRANRGFERVVGLGGCRDGLRGLGCPHRTSEKLTGGRLGHYEWAEASEEWETRFMWRKVPVGATTIQVAAFQSVD